MKRWWIATAVLAAMLAPDAIRAENAPGVTATEIKLGQVIAYSGVAAPVATPLAHAEAAYFKMVNDQGGIHGRKIVLESLDDGFDPKKSLELTKKMVEEDHVAAIFSPFATPANIAIRDYTTANKIPQLFIMTGDDMAGDYKHYPYITGGAPVFRIEAQIFGRYILVNMPTAKVGIIHGRDEMGDAYVAGVRQGLGNLSEQRIVAIAAFDDRAANVDDALATVKKAGADTIIIVGPPLLTAQAIAKTYNSDWAKNRFINFASSSGATLGLAGYDKATGLVTANSYADPTDPRWIEDGSVKPFRDFVAKYLPGHEGDAGYYLAGYVIAQAMAQTLIQCGDDLSRENIMAQALNLRDFHPVGLLPGISFNTSRTKHLPIVEAALQRFDGQHWQQIGEIMAGF